MAADKDYTLVNGGLSQYILAELPNKKIVAVAVGVNLYIHRETAKYAIALSDVSKQELAEKNLAYAGMHMKYIPLLT